jgi:hypothetical protein
MYELPSEFVPDVNWRHWSFGVAWHSVSKINSGDKGIRYFYIFVGPLIWEFVSGMKD